MDNFIEGITYSQILAERQGRGLSEKEVTDLLEQILPQLVQLHAQNKVHGAISLECILKQGERVILLPPTTTSYQSSIAQDIFDLGLSAITLLTAKNTDILRNGNRTWDWQDDCVISDRLAEVLEKAISIYPEHRYHNALAMQQALSGQNFNSNPTPQPQINPVVNDRSNTNIPSDYTKTKNKLADWHWIAIGTGVTFLIALAGFGIFSLLNKESTSEIVTNSTVNNPESNSEIIATQPNNSLESIKRENIDTVNKESQIEQPQALLRSPSPDRFVKEHYSLLNSRAYQVTWDNLTPSFQNIAGNFSGYKQWWSTVRRIEIGRVEIIEQSLEKAIVEAQISWVNGNGKVSYDSNSWVHLVWNDSANKWQIDKKSKPGNYY